MLYILKKMFFLNLIMSIELSISSNNMMMLWLSMELNTMSFIALINQKNFYKFNSLMMMKYFMIQSMSSLLFFLLFTLMYIYKINMMNLVSIMMFYIMMMKLGMPPFFYWYINMMKSLKWIQCMILSVLQKIIPMIILMKYITMNNIILINLVVSSMLSVIFGLKSSILKHIMSYSSINHLSWMIILMLISEKFMIMYFIIYMILSTKIMTLMHLMNLNLLNELMNIKNKLIMLLLMTMMLSLSGMPPFMGFLLKWFSLKFLLMNNFKMIILMIIMLMNSAITILYYINLVTPYMFINTNMMSYKLTQSKKIKFYLATIMFTSMYMLSLNHLF
uniref:NADH dehydrogenase subunit 2 n=1 Tax=Platygaster robiniae TaxID=2753657 RepID=UPI0021151C32|nr:NADH dehydrogenase subunit 2 [Platygaster robiniae]UTI38864.1 NADH dehydrogenase subunit 2 [Platygaster robiniae]